MSRIIVKNIPKFITEQQIKEHFSFKGEVTDVKLMKNRFFAFVGFKTESQGEDAIKYFNETYLKTSKITVEPAKVQGDNSLKVKGKKVGSKNEKIVNENTDNSKESKIKKLLEIAQSALPKNKFDKAGLEIHSKNKEDQTKDEKEQNSQENNAVSMKRQVKINPQRLYIRNIPFELSEDDLKNKFSKFGEISELFIPRNKNNQGFGYAYITYQTVESSVLALSEMDKSIFQGRILHISPSEIKEKREIRQPRFEENPTKNSHKKAFNNPKKLNFDDETNWNYLFVNQNSVVTNISKKLNISKSDLLSRDSNNLAVSVANMETHVINETKEWLNQNGMNFESLKGKRQDCVRSKNIILIKNISSTISKEKLEEIFSNYGVLVKFLIAPSNCFAIAEFVDGNHATNCMKNLAYFEVDGLPLYLEFAPEGLVENKGGKKPSDENKKKEDSSTIDLTENSGKIVFVKNLNFKTKESDLLTFVKNSNFIPVNVKIATQKSGNSLLSSGFGFVEFKTKNEAESFIKKLQGALLDNHSLKLNIAKGKEQKESLLGNKRKKETDLNDYEFTNEKYENTKILVKNLAFEATKEDIRALFKGYGEMKNIRLPLKTDGSHRGFCFVEFLTNDEAKNAFKKLQNSHLYGRKLVFEWAKKSNTLEELRENTRKKLEVRELEEHKTLKKANFDSKKVKKTKK